MLEAGGDFSSAVANEFAMSLLAKDVGGWRCCMIVDESGCGGGEVAAVVVSAVALSDDER